MFTGIIGGIGKVKKIDKTKTRSAIGISVDLGKHSKGLKIGESVALNGVCLTVIKKIRNVCNFEMIDETAKNTSLGLLKIGDSLNIERSVKAGSRMDGHFVLGHVDGVGTVKNIIKEPSQICVWFDVPKPLVKFIVKKGSIAIDGISLTVVDTNKSKASVCLIPHTILATNFQHKKVGDMVNIETDILGKYVLDA
ncbi:MAG: riboflavin synthase subunit alpha [Cenarchaeum symbiont of Oopsacas minuta]|nr:riboflavin synthase subunit alpha [Cenarchaeum symbiont of Oopsacas minuta]